MVVPCQLCAANYTEPGMLFLVSLPNINSIWIHVGAEPLGSMQMLFLAPKAVARCE